MESEKNNTNKLLQHGLDYVAKNNQDFVYMDEKTGKNILIPCESTKVILDAVGEYNDGQIRNTIKSSIPAEILSVVGKTSSDISQHIISMIKNPSVSVDDFIAFFNTNKINIRDWRNDTEQKYSILHFAARYDRPDLIALAISLNISVADQTFTGQVPMHYAMAYGACRQTLDLLYNAPLGIPTALGAKSIVNGSVPMTSEQHELFKNDPSWTPSGINIPEYFVKALISIFPSQEESKKRRYEREKKDDT
jgi:hypothetical protein